MDIIKLRADGNVHYDKEIEVIQYLGDSYGTWEVIEAIITSIANTGRDYDEENLLKDFIEFYGKENLVSLISDYIGEDEIQEVKEEFEDNHEGYLNEVVEEYFIYGDYVHLIEKEFDDDLEFFIDYLGLQMEKVGYSEWSLVIAPKNISKEFIQDFWEGWNFYSIEHLDEQGNTLDILGENYLTNTSDLKDTVRDYFGVEDFYLIDNLDSEYFDIKKVEEHKEVIKSYKIVS